MAWWGFDIIKNGSPKEHVDSNIRDCKDYIHDCNVDIREAQRTIKKLETKIRQYEKRMADYKALTIVNGKVVK